MNENGQNITNSLKVFLLTEIVWQVSEWDVLPLEAEVVATSVESAQIRLEIEVGRKITLFKCCEKEWHDGCERINVLKRKLYVGPNSTLRVVNKCDGLEGRKTCYVLKYRYDNDGKCGGIDTIFASQKEAMTNYLEIVKTSPMFDINGWATSGEQLAYSRNDKKMRCRLRITPSEQYCEIRVKRHRVLA